MNGEHFDSSSPQLITKPSSEMTDINAAELISALAHIPPFTNRDKVHMTVNCNVLDMNGMSEPHFFNQNAIQPIFHFNYNSAPPAAEEPTNTVLQSPELISDYDLSIDDAAETLLILSSNGGLRPFHETRQPIFAFPEDSHYNDHFLQKEALWHGNTDEDVVQDRTYQPMSRKITPSSHGANNAVIGWLRMNFQKSESSNFQRETLYNYYLSHCKNSSHVPATQATFGKLLRAIFPSVGTRRLGCRGNSKYHYIGIGIIPSSPLDMEFQSSGVYHTMRVPKRNKRSSEK